MISRRPVNSNVGLIGLLLSYDMRSSYRVAVGFTLGCVLSVCAFGLAGAGHGTYTPLTANAPMLIILPEIGVVAALIGAPLLWAGYYLAIPKINSRMLRSIVFVVVAFVHLGAGGWMGSQDTPYFARAFERHTSFMLFYFVVLIASVLVLGVLGAIGSRRQIALS